MQGYSGKILEIDLTSSKIRIKPLADSLIKNYIGGRGLATRLFFDKIDPQCQPLSPENILVFAASPLLSSGAPTACRGHLVFKSPLTGAIGSTNCGGSWARVFKASGYDAFIIKGKSPHPVSIDITADKTEIIPAQSIWGSDVHQTTDILSRNLPRSRILCIGPAGENLVRFAAVMNDKNRAYGRTGPGAVFGSKNLKAIRVSGFSKTKEQNKEIYQSGVAQARYMMKAAPVTKRLLRELGTVGLLRLIDVMDMLPHNNFQDNKHKPDQLEKISGETIRKKILKRPGACFGCPIGCQRHTIVGDKSGEGPEYETTVMMGPQCGIYHLEAITRANYLCNELGLDTISFGGTTACAMELYTQGYLSSKELGGIKLRFGQAGILEELVDLTARREGAGNLLAEGSYRMAEKSGHRELSMSVKKLEIPAYDPRASYAQALGYITSPTGACHLRGGYAVSLAFFGGAKEIPRFSLIQSPIAIRNMQNLGIIQDSLGICRFTGFAFAAEPWARMISGLTGFDFSTRRLEKTAERVAALERMFNLSAGFNSSDDTLPERFLSETISVKGEKRHLTQETIAGMKSDYYAVRGWDRKEGIPNIETLEKLEIKG